jgi:hypothetical protein
MGYIIQVILNFLIDLFFEEVEQTAPQPSSSPEQSPQPTESKITLEERAKQFNKQLTAQRRMSWTEFKENNQLVHSYLINKEVIP